MSIIRIEEDLLAENNRHAALNREVFDRRHTHAFNLISSPGAGKTTLLEETLTALRAREVGCAVIEGDQATDLDARRSARTGVPVFQIETGRSCHLDARQVQHALSHLDAPERASSSSRTWAISCAPPWPTRESVSPSWRRRTRKPC